MALFFELKDAPVAFRRSFLSSFSVTLTPNWLINFGNTVKPWQQANQLRYSSSLKRDDTSGTMAMAGWSDVVYEHTMCMGNCRLGSPILYELCHIIQFTSEFTRKLVKRSLEGEVYAFGDVVDHLSLLRAFYGNLVGVESGTYNLLKTLSPLPETLSLFEGNQNFPLLQKGENQNFPSLHQTLYPPNKKPKQKNRKKSIGDKKRELR